MKKYFFFALAVAGMLSSCSSDDIVAGGEVTPSADELMPIRIGMGQKLSTRGTGTVGGFDDESNNKWFKQKVNVYMLHKDSMGLAVFDAQTDPTPIYENAEFETPDGLVTGIATPLDNKVKYYPTQKRFDFWGYRLDGAETAAPVLGSDSLTVAFKIDGSQDVMVAKAVPSAADTLKLQEGGNTAGDRAFSAFAARWGVQPDLKFRHLLSRLTFDVIPGSMATVDANTPVIVDSIKVISPSEGTLVIAATGDVRGEKQGIIWNEESLDSLSLKQRKEGAGVADSLVKLDSDSLAGKGHLEDPLDPNSTFVPETVRVGEALMVAPGLDSYEVIIYLRQPSLTTLGSPATQDIAYSYKDVIKLNSGEPLKPGYSYKVNITLWGLSDINVSTTLEGWIESDDVKPLTPEDLD